MPAAKYTEEMLADLRSTGEHRMRIGAGGSAKCRTRFSNYQSAFYREGQRITTSVEGDYVVGRLVPICDSCGR